MSQQVTDVEVANQGLFENLIRHVKPLLNRLSNNIKVNNVLLSQIKLEYPQLFKIVSKGTKQLEKRFSLNEIGDEEIGFLTVYFVQAIESHHKPIETVVACTTGLGTAQLLKTKLQNRFSELKIVATVASHDVNKELSLRPNVKLLISTFDFNLSEALGGVDQIVVSALFNDEDQDRLERKIIELSGDSEADK